jgi:hypothetical protein
MTDDQAERLVGLLERLVAVEEGREQRGREREAAMARGEPPLLVRQQREEMDRRMREQPPPARIGGPDRSAGAPE